MRRKPITKRIQLLPSSPLNKLTLILVAGITAIFGVLIIYMSFAATKLLEAESGSRTGGATQVADSGASGGNYIKFQAAVTPPPPPVTPPPPPPASGAPRQPVVNVKNFGAKGDGSSDDQSAIMAAIASVGGSGGGTIEFPAGTYIHSNVIYVDYANVNLWTQSGATLKATNQDVSSVFLRRANTGIYNLSILNQFSGRGGSWHQTAVFIGVADGGNAPSSGPSGVTVKGIRINGSKSAGIMIDHGSSNFLIEGNTVENTLSDSIHTTGGSHDGIVRGNIIRNSGDDCVANVSYEGDGAYVYNMLDENNECYNGHARHFSVIGGHDITIQNNYSDGSSVASVMIAAEGSYTTFRPYNIKVLNNTFKNGNTGAANSCCSNHSTIHLYAGRSGYYVENIQISGNTIQNGARGPSLIQLDGPWISNVSITNNTMTDSNTPAFVNNGAPGGSYTTSGNTYNGSAWP